MIEVELDDAILEFPDDTDMETMQKAVDEYLASQGIAKPKEPQPASFSSEDIGTVEPWNTGLTGNVLFVVGAEREGVSQEVLEACDEIVRLPMDGFVPSYNLQVAISVLAVEALRQRQDH